MPAIKVDYDLAREGEGWLLLRQGKPFKTPAEHLFVLPTEKLATQVLREWQAQDPLKIKPETMPYTQYAATSLDLVPKERPRMEEQLLAYVDTELLCHRAANPRDLALLQAERWQPFVQWIEEKCYIKLELTHGLMPVKVFPQTKEAFAKELATYDAFAFAGLRGATDLLGSLVLGLSLACAAHSTETLFEAAELETLYQVEKWGPDEETTQAHALKKQELAMLEGWFAALREA